MPTAESQTYEFQAEIKQLLDIVIHSLYTEKEIFVRELVSNASDALEKERHLQVSEKGIYDDSLTLEINITTDDKAKTFTIQDFGVGMTREELVENLGTIAHSGSKAFLKALGEGDQKAAGLIGQFGVGFYSAFMVAKTVRVYTHSWRPAEPGLGLVKRRRRQLRHRGKRGRAPRLRRSWSSSRTNAPSSARSGGSARSSSATAPSSPSRST